VRDEFHIHSWTTNGMPYGFALHHFSPVSVS
jgi:hypothetical protein